MAMKTRIVILSFLLIYCSNKVFAHLHFPVSVPFTIVGSYLLVEVSVNNSMPLNFVLDSGVKNTIITELAPEDSLTLNYANSTLLKGLGSGNELRALPSPGNTLGLGKLELKNKLIYVLEEDLFSLSKHTGVKINGLLGSDIFQDYVVEINFNRQRLYFYEFDKFDARHYSSWLHMSIEGQKMFVEVPVVDSFGDSISTNLLVDTGAELAAWFKSYGGKKVGLPTKKVRGFIGQGLNGEIKGYFGRVSYMKMGDYSIKNPIVTFPDSSSIAEVAAEADRDGTLGSQVLNRFNLAFDVKNNRLYLRPNANFKKRFVYNIAGVELMQVSPAIRIPEVIYVWENSPAQKAGVKVGDQVLEIDGRKTFEMKISEVKSLFEKSSRYKIRLRLLRGDKYEEVMFGMNGALD